MQNTGTALIALGVLLLIGLTGWWYASYHGTAPEPRAPGEPIGTQFVFSTPDRTLRSAIVAAATKLGQGRPAAEGLPTSSSYTMPTLRETEAGNALMIPDGPIPVAAKSQEIKRIEDSTSGTAAIGFDIYSWSMGTLVATLAGPALIGNDRPYDVPKAIYSAAQDADYSHRLVMVLPAGDGGLPRGLNPRDAYVVVADISVSD